MEAALKDGDLGPIAFEAYDNEAFVGIQTASTEEELRAARDLLHFVHATSPLADGHRPNSLLEFHDYCARMRLAELEATLPA